MVWRKNGKNSSDIKMTQDITHSLYNEHINTYVLASGDSDFFSVIQDLKLRNKKVICVSHEGHTSNVIKSSCDEWVNGDTKTSENEYPLHAFNGDTKTNENEYPLSIKKIRIFIENVICKDEINIGKLKSKILETYPEFSEKDYGASSFLGFLYKCGFKNRLIHDGDTVTIA